MKAKNDSKTPKTSAAPKGNPTKEATETVDRLPTSLTELKASKGGLVAHLSLTGKDRDVIAKELAHAFKLPDVQALKITRRITGRVRLYQRVFELVPAKEA